MNSKIKFLILIIFFNIFIFKFSLALIDISDINSESFIYDWIPNGSIYDIKYISNKIFLAGNFSYLGPYKGNAFFINLNNNLPFDLEDKIDGIVWEVIPDGNGGWYVGGDFNKVGKYNIKKLAHILNDGKIDQNFSFNINDTVYALAKKGNVLYIGGAFENIDNRMGLNYLVAIDLETNSLIENFRIIPEDFVFDLVFDPMRNKLYVAGQFISVYDSIRDTSLDIPFLFAINLNSSMVDENFNFGVNDIVSKLFLSRDYNRLYFGGYFKEVASQERRYLAAVDLRNNQLLASFNPNVDYIVLAITQSKDGNNLYIGGRFQTVNNTQINYLALINSSTGSLIPTFNCRIESDENEHEDIFSVIDINLDTVNNVLFVGGSFKKVANQSKPNFFAAQVNNNQCQLIDEVDFDKTFFNNLIVNRLNINDRVNVLGLDNNKLFIGGRFYSYGGVFKKFLASINKVTNTIEINFNVVVDRPVYKLLYHPQNNHLYFIGYFNKVNNVDRSYIASLDLNNYSLTNFKVDFNTTTGNFVSEGILEGNNLYLGGYFTKVNNQNFNYLVKVNSLTGEIDNNFQPTVFDNSINTLAIKDNYLYVGGNFSGYLKVIDKNSGNLITNFKTDFNGKINSLFLDKDNNLLFVGGTFSQPNKNFVILNSQTGGVENKNYSPNKPVFLIKGDEFLNVVFVSGFFDNLGTNSLLRKSVFALNYDGVNFSLNSWGLAIDRLIMYAFEIDRFNKKIYLGGNFSFVNQDDYFSNLLVFNFEVPPDYTNGKDSRDSNVSVGGGSTGGGGGGGGFVPQVTRPTTTTSSDETLRAWLLQLVMQFISQQKTTTIITKVTTPAFKSKIKGIPDGFQFTRTLKLGMKGQDVKYLQIFLKAQGKKIYPEGKITGTFANATKKAVIRFQEKYKKELKIKKANGIVSGTTLEKINKMIREGK